MGSDLYLESCQIDTILFSSSFFIIFKEWGQLITMYLGYNYTLSGRRLYQLSTKRENYHDFD